MAPAINFLVCLGIVCRSVPCGSSAVSRRGAGCCGGAAHGTSGGAAPRSDSLVGPVARRRSRKAKIAGSIPSLGINFFCLPSPSRFTSAVLLLVNPPASVLAAAQQNSRATRCQRKQRPIRRNTQPLPAACPPLQDRTPESAAAQLPSTARRSRRSKFRKWNSVIFLPHACRHPRRPQVAPRSARSRATSNSMCSFWARRCHSFSRMPSVADWRRRRIPALRSCPAGRPCAPRPPRRALRQAPQHRRRRL